MMAFVGMLIVALAASSCIAPQRSAGVLVMASGADLESANPLVTVHPLSRQVQRYALLVTLVRYDSALTAQPYFARRWQWSSDAKTLTLSLVPDLFWHDGIATTAKDAAFTLLAAKDPVTGFSRASELASLDTAIAADDTTLVLRYASVQSRLSPLLAELPIVPAHRLAGVARRTMRTAAFNDAPVGNGPFKFVGRTRGARWTFARNEHFPSSLGGPPALAGFVVAVVDEATTKFAGLASGELDVAGISPTMASLAQRDATLQVLTYPVLFGTAVCFNTTRAPFDDERVRRAVARSIERQRIVEVALAGFARPASSPIPPDSPLAWAPASQRDTAYADSLLDAAGWHRGADGRRSRNGRPFVVELLTVGSGDNVAEQLIQSDLGARGITMTVRQTEMGAFLTAARSSKKTFDLALTGIPGDLSFSYVNALFNSTQRGGTLDYTGFHSAALDTLLNRAAAAPDGSPRAAAWRDVQIALDSLAPATWVYHSRGLQGLSRRVHGVHMDLRGELVTLHGWSFATGVRS
ncbi:MAG: ABC-type transporter, periplasmic subunit [Gemmatimonadetes bacterium]|nr:ABC-type transporter, periplasmic subunit [Gemmatimonadota bacterium]